MPFATLREYGSLREGQNLEFKDPRVLRDPQVIAREVCAFLNTDVGGELVIGIGDDGSLIPVEQADEERDRVLARLSSLIAPSLPARVQVDLLEGGGILVRIARGDNGGDGPYAVRFTKGRLGVFRRVGDRVVSLDWSEIRERLDRGSAYRTKETDASAEGVLLDWQGKLRKQTEQGMGALMLACTLDPRRDAPRQDLLRRAIEDPSVIGLRWPGMNYSLGEPPRRRGRYRLESGSVPEFYRVLEVDVRGSLRFATRLDLLLADGVPGCPRPRTLYPLSLIETVVSCLELFRALADSTAKGHRVACALDLTGIQGHSLPPFPHGAAGFLFDSHWQDPHRGPRLSEIVRASLDAQAFVSNPQVLAYELILWVYQEFGYDFPTSGEEGQALPYWSTSKQRFVFPE